MGEGEEEGDDDDDDESQPFVCEIYAKSEVKQTNFALNHRSEGMTVDVFLVFIM